MYSLKNKTWLLISSVFMILLIMGAASADEYKNSNINETITSHDDVKIVDTLSTGDSVDDQVSAADMKDLVVNDANNSLNSNKILTARLDSSSNNLLGDSGEFNEFTGSYSDLIELIKLSERKVTLQQNYAYQNTDNGIIQLSIDNYIIDGNGHTINGNNNVGVFTVKGNNITIKNLQCRQLE